MLLNYLLCKPSVNNVCSVREYAIKVGDDRQPGGCRPHYRTRAYHGRRAGRETISNFRPLHMGTPIDVVCTDVTLASSVSIMMICEWNNDELGKSW